MVSLSLQDIVKAIPKDKRPRLPKAPCPKCGFPMRKNAMTAGRKMVESMQINSECRNGDWSHRPASSNLFRRSDLATVCVPLTHGKVAIIDADDAERVLCYRWHAKEGSGNWYAARRDGTRTVRLHRFLMGDPPGAFVDHRNGNTLDDRRENLRVCTPRQNGHNRSANRSGTSGFKGVSRHKRGSGAWQASIRVDGKLIFLGRFSTAEEAARAYDAAALKYFGRFARLNFSEGES